MTRDEAEALMAWGYGNHAGPWFAHSYAVARAAETIAAACGMDAERAWLSGALHDIGRYEGPVGMRHIFAGYHLLMERDEPELARICLTHSFPLPDAASCIGAWDRSAEDEALLCAVLATPMDDYDRLIQLCDSITWGRGVCLLEKRIVDIMRRHPDPPMRPAAIEARFAILNDFAARMGHSVYDLFPEAAENTFS